MPRDGSGDYSLPEAAFVAGTTALSAKVNNNNDDIADALSDSINVNGTKAFAANQPMGNNKLTGLAAGSANGDSVRYEQLADYQPIDADLTAIAALGYTSGSYLIKKTAANTYSLITITAAGEAILDDADAAAQRTTLSAAGLGSNTFTGVQFLPNGSAAAPVLSAASDTDTGIYFTGSNAIIFATQGTQRWAMTGSQLAAASGNIYAGNGSVSLPTYSFNSDQDNGVYYISTNNWGLSAGGSKVVDIATTGVEVTGTLRGRLPTSSETSGTLTVASANKVVPMSGDITINDGVFADGDQIELYNDSDVSRTITQDTGMTLRLGGTTSTGSRSIAARGIGLIRFKSNSDATVAGTGVT